MATIPRFPIELDTPRGTCPDCGRPILTLTTGKCSYCGAMIRDRFADSPQIQARLGAMAPGWDLARLKAWVRQRPTLLARVMQEEAWPCLGGWVADNLWREWESRERLRKTNGQDLRMGGVVVQQVDLLALGDTTPWVAVRVGGRRSAFVVDEATGMVVSGNRGAKPFAEAWKLEATGCLETEPEATTKCHSCGASIPPEAFRCDYCRNWQMAPRTPWNLVALRDLMQETSQDILRPEIQPESPFASLFHREDDFGDSLFNGIMNNLIC